MLKAAAKALTKIVLDFALPPRCAGCGMIVGDVHSFCSDCWNAVHFLGPGGCGVCGFPLEATEADTCGRCLASPPLIARYAGRRCLWRFAKSIALRLKYGRKVALAKTMARFMAPLAGDVGSDCVLVPVPLHRRRIWTRGFNQSGLIARELSRRLEVGARHDILVRVKATPPLKGMSLAKRQRTVQGAFRVADGLDLSGKTVVLIDDVLTTGSTTEACAKSLHRAGAARVELLSWARVLRPSQLGN